MSDLAGSADQIGLGDNFYTILGVGQLVNLQDCTVQATPEDNIKLCVVLGSRIGSVRDETVQ